MRSARVLLRASRLISKAVASHLSEGLLVVAERLQLIAVMGHHQDDLNSSRSFLDPAELFQGLHHLRPHG